MHFLDDHPPSSRLSRGIGNALNWAIICGIENRTPNVNVLFVPGRGGYGFGYQAT